MKNTNINFALCALIIGFFLAFSHTAQAATYTVNQIGDAGDGTCDATCTLRDAILTANATADNDIIGFDAGVFGTAQTITLGGTELTIANNGTLTINGTGASLLTVSGNNASRVFNINTGANATLTKLTVTGGNTSGNGGGIYNAGTLTLTDAAVSGNTTTARGGGIFNEFGVGSAATLTNSIVSTNSAQFGGGIFNDGGTATLTNSTVSSNTVSERGGGIFNSFFGSAALTNSIVNNNTGTNDGGGFYNNFSSTAILTNTTVSGNSTPSGSGGGFFNDSSSTVTLTNSTVSGNTAPNNGSGGGIYNAGTATLNNSTVSNNSAIFGGGIRNEVGTTTLNNTIIANSTAGGDCGSGGGTINVTYSLIEDGLTCVSGTNSNNLTGDPNLGTLANNGGATQTHALLFGSIAIDKGNTTLTTDQRGSTRPVNLPDANYPNAAGGNGSDIGSFEAQSAPTPPGLTVTKTADTNDGVCDADCSLREAFDAADGNGQPDTINFNIPTTDAGCGGTASCTITLTSAIQPAADGGNLTTVTGTGANVITLSGGNTTRLFNISANVKISMNSLTIANGNGVSTVGTGFGGAINVSGAGSTLTLANVTLRNNSAGNSGGGFYAFDSTVTVTNSTITNNTATFGAGFYSERSSTTITDSTISSNTAATEGGGFINNTNVSGGSVTVNNSVINNNRANTGSGGGISTFGLGTLTINNSTISNSSSSNSGGGIIAFSGTTTLTNSTVSGNTSNANGGGIRNLGTANFNSTTFSNNSGNNGGGVSNGNGTMTLNNTIVANSLTGVDCGRTGGTVNATHSLIESGLGCVSGTNSNNLTGDPNLGALANNGGATETHALQTGSIAIDTGNSALTTDQRGSLRPVDDPNSPNGTGNLSDIGAFEVQSAATGGVSMIFIVNSTNDPGDGVCNAAECTLREAIAAANANVGGADQINFDASLAGQTITLTAGQLAITDVSGTLTINGLGANQLSVSGSNASRVFIVNGGTVAVINSISIINGNADFGGGVRNSGNLTVNNAVIRNNAVTNGGGGIRAEPGSATSVNNSTVSNNTSSNTGGGIDSNGSVSILITNSTISGNTATGSSGGIANTGTLTVTNSTISGNSSPFGGGIGNFGTATLNSSTVSNNTAANSAGGLRNANNGTTTLNNTIIANSTSGGDCVRESGTINATYSLIEQNLTCVNGTTNSNNLTGDPNLGALTNNGGSTETHALLPGSIAIDSGNSTLTTDQRGSMRPVDILSAANGTGNLSDIGAFEVQAATAASVTVSGRVFAGKERGLTNATVYLIDANGNTRTARTSAFGYFRFDDIAVGQTVVISVVSKRFTFAPQVVSVAESIAELNIYAELQN